MNINWSILVPGPGDIAIPTYGNYGGPGYSNGEVLAFPDQSVDYTAPPVDALDDLFRTHDMVYDSPDRQVRAEGDLALIQGLEALSQNPLPPEQSLYGGAAILAGIRQMAVVNAHPELLSQPELFAALGTAAEDIQAGLSHLEPADAAGLASWLQQVSDLPLTDILF